MRLRRVVVLQICGQTSAHSRCVTFPSTAPLGSGRAGLAPPQTIALQAEASRSFQFSLGPGGKQDAAGSACITYLNARFLAAS